MANPEPIQQRIEVTADTGGATEVSQSLEGLAKQNAEYEQAEQARTAQLEASRDELARLTRQQIQAERSIESGEQATEQSTRAERERKERMSQLSREIAEAEDEQARLNRRVREGVTANREFDDQGEETTESLGGLAKVLGGATNQVAAMAAAIVGSTGISQAYQQWISDVEVINERLKENGQLVRSNAEARLNFVALRGVEDPAEVARLDEIAAFSGRSPGEVARAAAIVESQFATSSDNEKESLLLEAGAAAQISDASLPELLKPLLGIFRQLQTAQRGGSIGKDVDTSLVAGNLFQEAIQQAGEDDPARLGEEIGKFIGVGRSIGGLDVGTSAGFAAAGTSLGLPNELATTGLKNVLFAIRGKGTPEGREILEREGIDSGEGADVLKALQQISASRAAGNISDAEIESLGGREAAPVFAALSDPAQLRDFIERVVAVRDAGRREDRIATDKAEGIFEPGSIQARNLQAKQEEARTESIRSSDSGAADIEAARAILDRLLAQEEARDDTKGPRQVTPALSKRIREQFEFQIAQGSSIEEAIKAAEQRPDTDFGFQSGKSFIGINKDRNRQGLLRGATNFLSDPLLDELERGPQIAPQEDTRVEPTADDRQSAVPVTDEAVALLRDIRDGLSDAPGGGTNIYGNVYTNEDPAIEGLAEAHRNA